MLYDNEMLLSGFHKIFVYSRVAPELLSVTGNPNATYWSLAKFYDDKVDGISPSESYPYRVFGTGTQNGLQLTLRLNRDDLDYMCDGPVQGFKVTLSSPAEIPLPSTNYFHVSLSILLNIAMRPFCVICEELKRCLCYR